MNKILIVNSADAGGGAERVATAILDGFAALGTETWMAVGEKRGTDPRVLSLNGRPTSPVRSARRSARRLAGLEDLDHPGSHRLLELAGTPAPDLLLLGNLHGDYFDLRLLPELSRRVPVVMRLADSWPFTGHCATPLGCGRWETGCGACPDLTIPPAIERDATRVNWRRKRSIFSRSRMSVVAPSRWQLDRARRSLLGEAIDSARVVTNGVDLETFNPDGPRADREALGVPPDARLLVFACNLGAANRYKDMATLRAAMRLLGGHPVELLVVGRPAPLERVGERVRIRHLPYEHDQALLAGLYRAADLYVHAAWEESFCLTAAEALACGTPVVAAGAGGLSEVVEDGVTGFVVPPGQAAELAAAVTRVLDTPDLARLGSAAAATARERFDGHRMVEELHEFCLEVARAWPYAGSSAAAVRAPA